LLEYGRLQQVQQHMNISEDFYSVQGEGITAGIPAYFIRLRGCNLMCGGSKAKLVKEGKASWWCDTEAVWKMGNEVSNDELIGKFQQAGQLENILGGRTHLIWTGGEPLMPKNVDDIGRFLFYVDQTYNSNRLYNEVETNGTFPLEKQGPIFQQINCSPKLSNSGMPESRRIVPAAIQSIMDHPNSWFKFVVSREKDVEDIENDYVGPFNIPESRVILQPASDSMATLPGVTRICMELTKKYGYRTMPRLHILAWDKVTGV